jgi:hypothetical protein
MKSDFLLFLQKTAKIVLFTKVIDSQWFYKICPREIRRPQGHGGSNPSPSATDTSSNSRPLRPWHILNTFQYINFLKRMIRKDFVLLFHVSRFFA